MQRMPHRALRACPVTSAVGVLAVLATAPGALASPDDHRICPVGLARGDRGGPGRGNVWFTEPPNHDGPRVVADRRGHRVPVALPRQHARESPPGLTEPCGSRQGGDVSLPGDHWRISVAGAVTGSRCQARRAIRARSLAGADGALWLPTPS